jgi:hypothetical protein
LVKRSLTWQPISVHQIPRTSLCHWRSLILAQFYRYISVICTSCILENFWWFISSHTTFYFTMALVHLVAYRLIFSSLCFHCTYH